MSLQEELQRYFGLCLIALTTTDPLTRAHALDLVGLNLDEARGEIAQTCWADRLHCLREAVQRQLPAASMPGTHLPAAVSDETEYRVVEMMRQLSKAKRRALLDFLGVDGAASPVTSARQ